MHLLIDLFSIRTKSFYRLSVSYQQPSICFILITLHLCQLQILASPQYRFSDYFLIPRALKCLPPLQVRKCMFIIVQQETQKDFLTKHLIRFPFTFFFFFKQPFLLTQRNNSVLLYSRIQSHVYVRRVPCSPSASSHKVVSLPSAAEMWQTLSFLFFFFKTDTAIYLFIFSSSSILSVSFPRNASLSTNHKPWSGIGLSYNLSKAYGTFF